MEPLPAWYLRRRAHYLPGNEVQLLKGGQELFAALVAKGFMARRSSL